MGRLPPARLQPGGHGLDTLAFARQQQAGAVGPCRHGAVSTAERAGKTVQIHVKPLLRGPIQIQVRLCHSPHMGIKM
jgi:hypothetical protein